MTHVPKRIAMLLQPASEENLLQRAEVTPAAILPDAESRQTRIGRPNRVSELTGHDELSLAHRVVAHESSSGRSSLATEMLRLP